jgi:HupE / UreJ protein
MRANTVLSIGILVAFTFGLLRGFGFAGALAEVGLSPSFIPIALLFFNVGVERRHRRAASFWWSDTA